MAMEVMIWILTAGVLYDFSIYSFNFNSVLKKKEHKKALPK